MSQRESMKIAPVSGLQLEFNLPFIVRTLKKWSFVALCCACICMVAAYIFMDFVKGDTYTATALITVAPKNNNTGYLNTQNVDDAITRNIDMWNSEILIKAIQSDYPDTKITGTLKAESVGDAEMLTLTATAGNARDAYFLLKEAISHYKDVSQHFDTTYRTVFLTVANKDAISAHKYSKWKYALLGFVGGLCVCWAILIYWTAQTNLIYCETQAQRLLDAPVFGSLQKVRRVGRNKNILINRNKLPLSYLESMDMLTSQVEQSLRSGNKKVLMVTSVHENDGKSSVSANLALTLAQRNRRVLLIDLDLRQPSLWKIFNQKELPDQNLYSALKNQYSFENCICQDSENPNLSYLWQFKAIRDADGFLENSDLSSQLARIRQDYDYLVLDTPPIGIVRDAEVIGSFADHALLLVRQDTCQASIVNDIIDQLEECGASCSGVVLNQCRGAIEFVRRKENSHYHRYHKYLKGDR